MRTGEESRNTMIPFNSQIRFYNKQRYAIYTFLSLLYI